MSTNFNAVLPWERALRFVSPVLVLLGWWWVCGTGWFPEQILVSPYRVFDAATELWGNGELQMHLHKSLYRLTIGFAFGAFAGIAFGVAMGLSSRTEGLCAPMFHAIRQVPVIAFIPMLVLIFGVEETFKIVVVAASAFFPVALAAFDAVKGISRSHLEVAKVYQLPVHTLVRRIILPSTVPPILTGLRLSLGRSWMVLVAAELLAADTGVGQMMEMGRQMFRLDVVMVGVFVTGATGFLLDRSFRLLEYRLAGWKHQ